MALHTDNFTVTKNWQEIPLLDNGTFVQVVYTGIEKVYARVDGDSTAVGVRLDEINQFKAPESIYIKSEYKDVLATIIRDGDE